MIGKLIGLLGGGPAAKIALVAGGAMVAGMVGLGVTVWLQSGKIAALLEDKGVYKQTIKERDEDIKSRDRELVAWEDRFNQEQARRLVEEQLRLELMAERDLISAEAGKLRASLQEMKKDVTVKTYLEQRVPDVLLECLRHEGQDHCGTRSPTVGGEGGQSPAPG